MVVDRICGSTWKAVRDIGKVTRLLKKGSISKLIKGLSTTYQMPIKMKNQKNSVVESLQILWDLVKHLP